MRHIIPISGKDSLATALVCRARYPDREFEYMFNPTGAELPEVNDWLARVETYLGKPIVRVGANLSAIIAEYGYFLPSQQNRYCTRLAKLAPTDAYVGTTPTYLYYGIRADEDRGGYVARGKSQITPVYPLKEMGIDLQGVLAINAAAGLKPPTFFWQTVHDMVIERIGEGAVKRLTEIQFDTLFAWRSRTNCHYCFNQRLYEWAGLLEHHPDLFWQAEALEHKGSEYTWNSNKVSLKRVSEQVQSIRLKRVTALIKLLKGGQMNVFEEQFYDVLSVTSCGLVCGK